ncbi:MAG: hypothetical protein KAQ78_00895 [Candidatus Latescibacteria bacterium]|nr:hypothetical protein [Candidatus Latescibacterota bacterium]
MVSCSASCKAIAAYFAPGTSHADARPFRAAVVDRLDHRHIRAVGLPVSGGFEIRRINTHLSSHIHEHVRPPDGLVVETGVSAGDLHLGQPVRVGLPEAPLGRLQILPGRLQRKIVLYTDAHGLFERQPFVSRLSESARCPTVRQA